MSQAEKKLLQLVTQWLSHKLWPKVFFVFFFGLLLHNLWPTEENEMLRINCSYLRAE